MVILLLACAGSADTAGTTPPMPASDLLIRASIDLRGVRPSSDEFAAVEADPAAVEGLIDGYLQDPRFEGRVADLFQEIFLTRNDAYLIGPSAYGLVDQASFNAAIGDEVPRIIGYIAAHDLPWTDVVTADWTMANEITGQIWPMDYPAGGSGWQQAHYTDGRPAAGVLSTNSLWWRYTSTTSNSNRKRANAISRTLLCNDYLSRPISFDRNVNLLDSGAVADALRENPACVNCHKSLDPIASYLFGFWWYDYTNPGEASRYFPEREQHWKDYTAVAPSWYGQPGGSLRDLGQQIAADPRFPECVVEQSWELLLRRDKDLSDTNALIPHRNAFIEGGLTLRTLFKSILSDPYYRAGNTDATGYVNSKIATPALLASEVEDLTGFRWTYGGFDMLKTDASGFLTLAGGADGYAVTASATRPNATLLLVQERLAEAAAWYVVQTEPERLFTIDFATTPDSDPAAMVAQIQSLHWRIFGRRVSAEGQEVAAGLELWQDLYAIERNGASAWAGLLSALLRDPDFLIY